MLALTDAQMDKVIAKMSLADEEAPGDLTEDAISAMLDSVCYTDEQDHKNYASRRSSLYWRLEEILMVWEEKGVDTTSLLKEFIQAMREQRDI